jgi:hypothetical protein
VLDAKLQGDPVEPSLAALILGFRTKRPPVEDYKLLEPLAKLALGQKVAFADLVNTAQRRATMVRLARNVAKATVNMLAARKARKRVAEQKACGTAKKSKVAVPLGKAQAVKPIFALDLPEVPSKSNATSLDEADLDTPFVMHLPEVQKTLQAGPWVLLLCPLLFVVVVVAKEVTVTVVDLVLLV